MSVIDDLVKHAQKSKSPINYRLAGTWVIVDEDRAKEMGHEEYFKTVCQAYKSLDSKAMRMSINFARDPAFYNHFEWKGNWHGLGYGEYIVYDLSAGEIIIHEVVQ